MAVAVCGALLFALLTAQVAQAHIFWSAYDSGNSKVGRAALDGGEINPALVTDIYFGQGVATDGTYVYWGESGSNPKLAHIGRARVDGSEPNHAFQQGATYCGIFDIVASSELFWLKSDCSGLQFGWDIDRTALSGGGGNYAEVGAGSHICGFDVDANYVYWSEKHFIARASLPGPALPDREWLDVGASVSPCAVAVDSGHVYWTTTQGAPTYRGTNIGRASISGEESTVENAFITGARFTSMNGIDVADGFIYWTNGPGIVAGEVTGSIGRASVDGSGVAHFFISPLFNPNSIDVDAGGPKAAPPGDQGSGPPPFSSPVPPLNVGQTSGGGAPSFGGVSTSNRSFAPGSASTPARFRPQFLAGISKAVPRGTVFSYTLDRDAAMTVEMKRKQGGRLVGKKCRKPTEGNAKKKPCDLLAHAPLKGSGEAGRNELPYSGRFAGKALTPGAYVAVFTATANGKASKPAAVGFTIVKP